MTLTRVTGAHYLPTPNLLVSELTLRLSSGLLRRVMVRATVAPSAASLIGRTVAQVCTQLFEPFAHPAFCDCPACTADLAMEQALEGYIADQWEQHDSSTD